ncbi:hypothetical protein FTUN_4641 [Frigoriglobus tundricola]|uniref:Transposase IS701-like DDE domain-containing protein n=1 Tax=Frigoriglobus tundricola TaxID=2774151 RepID=A0A6M5YUK6_9BACT|nr:hypothetical protein FTUN_4641 [Frigoriglobus tundricola]
MPSSHTPAPRCPWFSVLAKALDPRSGRRLAALFRGLILASRRQTLRRWIRAAGRSNPYRRCSATAAAVGRRTEGAAAPLLLELLKPLVADTSRLVRALDDTPTERYGPQVQGAGVHHHPTPGPAGSPFVYGHVWVVLGLLGRTRWAGSWPCPGWPGCTSARRTSERSRPSTDPRSRPSWRWPWRGCGGRTGGSSCGRSRCGWWPTGRTPKLPSSSPCGSSG